MKIYKSRENLIKAWMLATSGLENIKETLLDNRVNEEEVIDAYYTIMKACNNWNNEINNNYKKEE